MSERNRVMRDESIAATATAREPEVSQVYSQGAKNSLECMGARMVCPRACPSVTIYIAV
ncbi:MAG: hypothetical protein PHQ34_07890 [Methanothrix sp.]|nr:hypothetical protein [Methanothrix sp.]